MDPLWFFSSPQLAEYMPIAVGKRWNTSDVGIKLEAFAVAGSNVMSMSFSFVSSTHIIFIPLDMLKTSKAKAEYMKRRIVDMIAEKLSRRFFMLRLDLSLI
jgi:predicted secreted Zn-dependent protease